MSEIDELLFMLADQRRVFLIALRGVDDAQAATRSTVSTLTLGGLAKHLTAMTGVWQQIVSRRDGAMPDGMLDPEQYEFAATESLAALIEAYEQGAADFDRSVRDLPDLDVQALLPQMPWMEPTTIHWSARRIVLHVLRETAQHAGHADIVRESLDGASTTKAQHDG